MTQNDIYWHTNDKNKPFSSIEEADKYIPYSGNFLETVYFKTVSGKWSAKVDRTNAMGVNVSDYSYYLTDITKLSDEVDQPQDTTLVPEYVPKQPFYKGKGEHSVNELEAICEAYKKYVSYLNSRP